MKSISMTRISFLVFAACTLTACGGGGGGGSSSTPTPVSFSTFQNADKVIGQVDFAGHSSNKGGSVDATTVSGPLGNPVQANGTLFISDTGNNRILAYTSTLADMNASASFVIGQSSDTGSSNGTSKSSLYEPMGLATDGTHLFVADNLNSRVLIYNSIPSSGPVDADVAVGQTDLSSGAQQCGAGNMTYPTSVAVANGKLIVADSGNNRVLIWNSIPSTNGVAADIVLGQNDMSTCVANNDGTGNAGSASAISMDTPTSVWSDGTRLVVADSKNNRVLIWTSFPTQTDQAADLVLGQGDFNHSAYNDKDQTGSNSGISGATLNQPYSVTSNGSDLIVVDKLNARVLIWNSFPTQNFQTADKVLGQGDFTHNVANDDNQDDFFDGQPTARTLYLPQGAAIIGNRILVDDTLNNRVLVYEKH